MKSPEYNTPVEFFRHLSVVKERLQSFGFKSSGKIWKYEEPIMDGAFLCAVTVDAGGNVSEKVVDVALGEEYVQHRIADAVGAFVGRVRQEVAGIFSRIAQECFEREVFKGAITREIIAFARNEWHEELEFLWQKFPENAVLRRPDNNKWYAAILRVAKNKLGFDSGELVDIIDLRRTSEEHDSRILPGYHMNKQTWVTIILDGTMSFKEIRPLLVASREAAADGRKVVRTKKRSG